MSLIYSVQVSEKRAAWLKLRGLAAGNRWEDLLAFANEKKSPIGYEPFVEVCMFRSNFSAAESYCEKVADHGRRSQLYLGESFCSSFPLHPTKLRLSRFEQAQ